MNRKSKREIFLNGLLYENPLLISALGICSALSMTSKTADAFWAGLTVLFTLVCTNVFLSALKRVIPAQVRIPCSMLIIATFVTVGQLLSKAYLPSMDQSLSDYLPLITANCIILGRGEIFACRNSIVNSAVDGFGCGCGYLAALLATAMLREILGSGTLLGLRVLSTNLDPVPLFIMVPGGLFVIGILMALLKKLLSLSKPVSQNAICSSCPASPHCPRVGKGGCTR
ncbi:MAG: electron transport complex subunit RsxE [Firmicutes bacterium]|nr:electron transport complex subunit RsxE [Bacillota bacterium]